MPNKNQSEIVARFEPATLDALNALADRIKQPRSNLVREAIADLLAKYSDAKSRKSKK